MNTLALKLIITPTLVGLATYVGRRWGAAVSGWLVGIPFTSGPITFFLALSQGTTFAAATAVGILTGTISQAIFCLLYGWLALRFGWRATLALGCLIFLIATATLQAFVIPLIPLFLISCASLVVALWLMPDHTVQRLSASPAARRLRGDLPLRMIVATAFVLLITEAAPLLGAHLTGLLAPFPLYTAILAVFAQRTDGATAAINVVRGLLYGLFGFAGFFLVLAALLDRLGMAGAFVLALLVALVAQTGSLWLIRRPPRSAERI